MTTLLTLILLISIVALIVGLIKPSIVLRWERDEDKHTRKNVLKYFLTAIVVSFLAIAILPADTSTKVVSDKEVAKETLENNEFKISEADKKVLSKDFTELTEAEASFVDSLRGRIEYAEDGDNKEYAIENLARLKTEKEVELARIKAEEEAKAEEERIAREEQEEKDRIAREEQEEKDRIAKEKQDKIDKEAKEKEEKEKYNTGITWQDMARDKDGLVGSLVKFKGKILQVMSGSGYMQYRMAVDSDYDKVILIQINDDKLDSNIIEDDIITVEGMSTGNIEYTTVMGAKQSIPSMMVAKFTAH